MITRRKEVGKGEKRNGKGRKKRKKEGREGKNLKEKTD